MGAGTLGKNIQYQTGPGDDTALQGRFEIALLTGRQWVIENHQIRALGFLDRPDFLQLARTDEKPRRRRTPVARHQGDRAATRRHHQILKLTEVECFATIVNGKLYQNYIFAARVTIKQLGV